METKRCALYLRVSTDRQAQVKDGSLDTQEKRLRAYIDSKDGEFKWIVQEIYREEGRSGKNMNRPEFQRMMNDIENGEIDVVLCTKLDRITRQVGDFDKMALKFDQNNVDFVSIGDSFDTSTATGRAILKITLVFAQLEREQVGERVTVGQDAKTEAGYRVGGQPPLGYNLHPIEAGRLVKNSEEAKLVKIIYDMYEKEGSIGIVTSMLNKKGYRTKEYTTRERNQRGGNLFSFDTVHRILINPVYIGKLCYKDKVYDSFHESIISEDQFYTVQGLIKANNKVRGNTAKSKHYNYMLVDIATCVNCGSSMTGTHTKKKDGSRYFYYRCVNKNKKGKLACNQKDINAKLLETFVVEYTKKLNKDKKRLSRILKDAKSSNKSSIEKLMRRKSHLNNKKRQVDDELNSLIRYIPDESIGTSLIQSKISQLDKNAQEIDKELESLVKQIESERQKIIDSSTVKSTLEDFSNYFDELDDEMKKEALKLMIKNVSVSNDHILIFYYGSKGKLKLAKPKTVNSAKSEFGQYLGKHAQ